MTANALRVDLPRRIMPVFKADFVYHSTLGLRVIKKKNIMAVGVGDQGSGIWIRGWGVGS